MRNANIKKDWLEIGRDYWIKFKWPYNPAPETLQVRIGKWDGSFFITAAGHAISLEKCIEVSQNKIEE